ncbi:MAG TPA: hypothetical protein VD735_05220, partial [Candidatus Saccharimonadales bacterium]|nr:hypothetical protein [Candidatus Saccharimonadales bacterium]
MNDQKQQVAERVKEANNILVTVSANPSVDQLAACIGLTLTLNKMGKHATAVFSGEVPAAIQFLQPEKTIEKNTDSLRDFIIALDKSKADKLRYKVEDKVVKIFITPYRTSISEKDLEFSQGDFNVDVVLALGVHNQADLDQAITAHGRILHDATVVTINNKPGGEIGSINWLDPMASSLSELSVQLVDMLDKSLLDGQIATAMLTGIVAETERFSNSKTSPRTMTISAELMTAGANQQLVATKLQAPAPPPPPPTAPTRPIAEVPHEMAAAAAAVPKSNDGTLEIKHEEKRAEPVPAPALDTVTEKPQDQVKPEPPVEPEPIHIEAPAAPAPAPAPAPIEEPKTEEHQPELQAEPITEEPEIAPEPEVKPPQIHIDEHGSLSLPGATDNDVDLGSLPPLQKKAPPSISHHAEAPRMILEPPTLGGQLTANTNTPSYDTSADPLAGGLPSLEAPTVPEVHAAQPA